MMAAYQPQGMHPGMTPHGHPAMAPGQPLPGQMQQMGHPGVSGPGAPHVSQAGAMMGMQPGASGMAAPGGMGGQHPGGAIGGMPAQMGGQSMAGGAPTAHALSHLTPQAAMMQQQQQQLQQQLQANPQLTMQHQQALIRRQQQQAAMAHMQANGMVSMQQGGMQGMSPQQIQHFQQNNPGVPAVQLPQHLMAQQQQIQMAQRQQAAQQNQQQMQQHLAMQHANSQHSNQGQPGPPNQQVQPQQPPQMRPQSRMANPNEQAQGGPQQGHLQGPQGQQQTPNQQQGQQQNQLQSGPPQQMSQQQLQVLHQRQRIMLHQQQNALQARAQQIAQVQQAQEQNSGKFILKLMLFGDHLSLFSTESAKDMNQWARFVENNFSPDGRLLHSFTFKDGPGKRYEILRPSIARYFAMYFESGAHAVRLHIEHARETPMNNGKHHVSFSNATFTVAYPNGARLEMTGSFNVLFAPNSQAVECMEILTTGTEEVISRSEIEKVLNNWSPTMATKQSPKMAKNKLPKAQQKLQAQADGLMIDHFPKVEKGSMGITSRVQNFLEICETMGTMADLMGFAQEKRMRPEQALDELVGLYENQGANGPPNPGNPQINLPNGVPGGNRTPSMQNMQMPHQAGGNFSSPATSNLNLPMQNGMNGSPHLSNHAGLAPNMNMQPNSHTPSPHQSNMAAPQMIPQHSQPGTSSSAASTNTSPNVSNKRRRSAVKLEGDEGGGDGPSQANRVKPSPRMNKKAKAGGGA